MNKVFLKLVSLFPLKNMMVFESNPDFADNTYPVYCELRRRLPDYKMIWLIQKDTPIIDGVDDVFYYADKSLLNRFKL